MTEEIFVYGVVQGVGFRPFVHRLAEAHGLSGEAANEGPYVRIVASGTRAALAAFRRALVEEAPARASVARVEAREVPPFLGRGFSIAASARADGARLVPPDIAMCEACRAELFDAANRRYLHPFINCTACGPRFTILDALPYDRARTSMAAFPLCGACAAEYGDIASRRYDAQPVCCHDCGPRAYLLDGTARGAAAITRVRAALAAGGIAAVKGVGGFHLCCDAANEAAVLRLRERKRRPSKPFAVMARDLAAARREAVIPPELLAALDGPEKPILLLDRRGGGRVARAVAPALARVGLMLPYTPLHALLFDYPDGLSMSDVLVMTSANAPGAPICRTDEEARETLAPLADVVLSHDRAIRMRADDSVAAVYADAPYMVRRSRGYAPLPVALPEGAGARGAVLAVGAELKNTICFARDGLLYPSAHIGDLDDARATAALRETAARMAALLDVRPEAAACDLHPESRAARYAASLGLPVVRVQHHHAHIASCMAENGYAEAVIGVAFDGTGWGPDGSVWGGEILRADYTGFTRLGSIEPFVQAGGARAAREGWRVAMGLLCAVEDAGGADALAAARALGLGAEDALAAQSALVRSGVNAAVSTSAGRLFDAVSAALGLCRVSSFEGEAAMALQAAAESRGAAARALKTPPLRTAADGRVLLPTTALFAEIARRRRAGEDAAGLARAFHEALAALIAAACGAARARTGLSVAALSGGVFQNTLLLRLTEAALSRAGFRVLRHRLVPPNDGGLSVGQAAVAAARLGAAR